ncbi:MAG: hypothetical protein ABSH12_06545 [Endomicrobiales bacterium]|jgi:hypothetical protein
MTIILAIGIVLIVFAITQLVNPDNKPSQESEFDKIAFIIKGHKVDIYKSNYRHVLYQGEYHKRIIELGYIFSNAQGYSSGLKTVKTYFIAARLKYKLPKWRGLFIHPKPIDYTIIKNEYLFIFQSKWFELYINDERIHDMFNKEEFIKVLEYLCAGADLAEQNPEKYHLVSTSNDPVQNLIH